MSMNLGCMGFNVVQTPTYITYMIYDNATGGMEAIKRRYLNYIKYLRQDQFNSCKDTEEQKDIWHTWTEHIKECENSGSLTFMIV